MLINYNKYIYLVKKYFRKAQNNFSTRKYIIMKYNFVTKDTFNSIIESYIIALSESKQEKALINLNLLNKIKEILLNPKDL